ncbi:MAG TPA: cytochrome c maturation protein CcmE [Longimicrobiales bacterium]|nr:cytochrome c maturation protein CcmE [Longimicrobiales bacterium]
MKGRKAVIVVGTLLVLSGFGYLVWGGLGSNIVYFLTPTELMARGNAAFDAPVRLGGQVVPGSIAWDAQALDLRFQISDGESSLEVRSKGAPPAMFKDTMGVVVEGTLTRTGVFESTNLMVRHSNEYRAPPEGHRPVDVYQTLIREDGQG